MPRTLLLSSRVLAIATLVLLVVGCSGTGRRADLSGARQEIVINAIAQIGAPYRYGGASPASGFDCSGLVQYAHLAAGIKVPRITREQQSAAHSVSRSRLQPGDLVFFKLPRGQYHVGILVEDGRFVHAPSSGKQVKITKLDTPYWRKRFSGGGTFLN